MKHWMESPGYLSSHQLPFVAPTTSTSYTCCSSKARWKKVTSALDSKFNWCVLMELNTRVLRLHRLLEFGVVLWLSLSFFTGLISSISASKCGSDGRFWWRSSEITHNLAGSLSEFSLIAANWTAFGCQWWLKEIALSLLFRMGQESRHSEREKKRWCR